MGLIGLMRYQLINLYIIRCRWPAVIIPSSMYGNLPGQVDLPALESEVLVCYFEDGSFSVVGRSDCRPFQDLLLEYYSSKLVGPLKNSFLKDKAVQLATYCFAESALDLSPLVLPPYFTWNKSMPGPAVSATTTALQPSLNNQQDASSSHTTNTSSTKRKIESPRLDSPKRKTAKMSDADSVIVSAPEVVVAAAVVETPLLSVPSDQKESHPVSAATDSNTLSPIPKQHKPVCFQKLKSQTNDLFNLYSYRIHQAILLFRQQSPTPLV